MNGRKEGNEFWDEENINLLRRWSIFFCIFIFFWNEWTIAIVSAWDVFIRFFYILLFFLLLFSDFHFFVIKIHKFSLSLSLSNLSIKIFPTAPITITTTTHHHHRQSINHHLQHFLAQYLNMKSRWMMMMVMMRRGGDRNELSSCWKLASRII